MSKVRSKPRKIRGGGTGSRKPFDESKHRREDGGRFGDKPGAGDDAPRKGGWKKIDEIEDESPRHRKIEARISPKVDVTKSPLGNVYSIRRDDGKKTVVRVEKDVAKSGNPDRPYVVTVNGQDVTQHKSLGAAKAANRRQAINERRADTVFFAEKVPAQSSALDYIGSHKDSVTRVREVKLTDKEYKKMEQDAYNVGRPLDGSRPDVWKPPEKKAKKPKPAGDKPKPKRGRYVQGDDGEFHRV